MACEAMEGNGYGSKLTAGQLRWPGILVLVPGLQKNKNKARCHFGRAIREPCLLPSMVQVPSVAFGPSFLGFEFLGAWPR